VTYILLRKGMPTKHEVRKQYLQEEVPFDEELKRENQRDLEQAPQSA
jgi:hypothetical protein